jgi:hypothetical protein
MSKKQIPYVTAIVYLQEDETGIYTQSPNQPENIP